MAKAYIKKYDNDYLIVQIGDKTLGFCINVRPNNKFTLLWSSHIVKNFDEIKENYTDKLSKSPYTCTLPFDPSASNVLSDLKRLAAKTIPKMHESDCAPFDNCWREPFIIASTQL